MGLVSKQLVDFVKSFEGFSATVYKDEVGVPTLGYGMTGEEITGLSYITEEQASNMLENWLNNKYAGPIKSNLDNKGIVLNQNQFDALVSMAYNIGVGGLLSSTLYKNICNGVRDVDTITTNFIVWSKAGGQTLPGLLRRRQEEAAMFFQNGNEMEERKVKNLVAYGNDVDRRAAEYLADYLECPVIHCNLPFDYTTVENIYGVGAGAFTSYTKQIIGHGKDRYGVVIDVLKFCGKL